MCIPTRFRVPGLGSIVQGLGSLGFGVEGNPRP